MENKNKDKNVSQKNCSKTDIRKSYSKTVLNKFRKQNVCPRCGSNEYIPVLFGRGYNREDKRKIDKGELLFGGCCATPKHKFCKKCRMNY